MNQVLQTAGPLSAALLYSVSTYLLRRAALAGTSYRMQLIWTGVGIGLTGVPVLLIVGFPLAAAWIPALVAGASFGAGQFLTVVAVNKGDASIQTPLMGTKVIWVIVVGMVLFGQVSPGRTWLAALLAAAAVFAVGFTRSARSHASSGAIAAALGASASFAVFDSMVASGRYGGLLSGFFAMSVMSAGGFTAGVAALTTRRDEVRETASPVLVAATILLSLQFALQVGVIAAFGQAPEANILYATRGLWSVALAWLIAQNDVRPPRTVFVQRMVGAALLIVAVVLIL